MDIPQQSPMCAVARQLQLRIDGLVAQPCLLTSQDLAHFLRASVTEWLPNSYDGVTVQETWRGVRLLAVLHLAQPLSSAQYVRVHAGEFIMCVSPTRIGSGKDQTHSR